MNMNLAAAAQSCLFLQQTPRLSFFLPPPLWLQNTRPATTTDVLKMLIHPSIVYPIPYSILPWYHPNHRRRSLSSLCIQHNHSTPPTLPPLLSLFSYHSPTPTSSPMLPPRGPLLRPIKLLINQMQQQIHIQPQPPLEKRHELVRLKLRLQQVLDRHQRARARHLDVRAAALEREDADLVARDGQVDLAPVALGDPLPGDEDALVREGAGRVLVRAELGDAAGTEEVALVVVLFGEGEEETFFAGGLS